MLPHHRAAVPRLRGGRGRARWSSASRGVRGSPDLRARGPGSPL